MSEIVYKNKINKIRTFALSLIFAGIAIMYLGILSRKYEWLMLLFFGLGLISIVLSCVVYVWIGLLSTKAVPVICPTCEKHTKMLGRVDACMHCKQPLTVDKSLEGEEFDEKYNTRRYQREEKNRAQ